MEIPVLVKAAVSKIDKNSEVILFGSRARGDARPASDLDFLILLNTDVSKEAKNEIIRKLYDLELSTDAVISSIIHTRKEWKNRAVTPIYKAIQKEGIKI